METPTVTAIEKALTDIQKGMATKSEVLDLIDKRVAADAEARKAQEQKIGQQLDEAQAKMTQLAKANEMVMEQIKLLRSTRFAAIKTSDGLYNGCWGSVEMARNFGMFILAEINGRKEARKYLEAMGIEARRVTGKDMGEDADSTGGILVPTEFIPNLIMLIEKYGVFRRNALEWPMSSDSAIAPKLSSGLTIYCPGAGVAPSKTDAAFRGVGMVAKKWIGLTAIDSELTEDAAIAIGEVVGYLLGQAFAKKEDEVGFLGDSTSTYFGHQGIAGALRAVDATIGNIKSLTVGTGNAYSELELGDFEKVIGNLPDFADNGDAKWYVHRYFYATVMVAKALAAGGANATEIGAGRTWREKTFLGYPVEFTQVMPKAEANSQICALLANLRMGAYLGDRRRLTIDRSSERYFDTDQIGIRGTERVAPAIHGVGDTTDPGPICGLITQAS